MPNGINKISWIIGVLLFSSLIWGISAGKPPKYKEQQVFRVAFYNLENLFDWEDEPKTDDHEFLPNGVKAWTKERYNQKLNRISRVIRELSPDVMGVCEVENRRVLENLINQKALQKQQYALVHYDSPDSRGLDVGFIYRKGRFNVMKTASYQVIFPGDMRKPSPDILYVKGRTDKGEELHFVVNHWPDHKAADEWKSLIAGKTARRLCDSILFSNNKAKIILLGDFNDEPNQPSLREALGAQIDSSISENILYNLMAWRKNTEIGSYYSNGHWSNPDQIIVSASLVKAESGLKSFFNKSDIADYKYLKTKRKHGQKGIPLPTYMGDSYTGGYSEHFPVYADFYFK